ncbi:hypothetical protein H4582DRAFT_2070235 [Lactarius indigo]|nr:hypothetical protein H4582DRAFT_2070235 [Lactarius indigo]
MSYDLYEEGHFLSPSSSTPKKSPPSRHTLSRNRSNTSLRGGASSLAHELAVALLPEPTAGSKLLAEEFGIEYDEGAEGIDAIWTPRWPSNSTAAAASGSSTPGVTDSDDTLDPSFHSSPAPRARPRTQPEGRTPWRCSRRTSKSTEQFLTHLRHLDTDGPAPLALEALAADIISRLNETCAGSRGASPRAPQMRARVPAHRDRGRRRRRAGGPRRARGPRAVPLPPLLRPASTPALETVAEEPSFSHEWEVDPDAELLHQPDGAESDMDVGVDVDVHGGGGGSSDGSPLKDSFPVSPPPPLPLPASGTVVAIPHLVHLRTHTASLVSSLTALSEHAQVNGAATTDAGRGWRTDWDSAERSRARIERWETGVDVEGARRVDGRAFVAEHLREFERVLFEANMKTQAIMAPS